MTPEIKPVLNWKRLPVKWVLVVLGSLALAGCSRDDEKKVRFSKPASPKSTTGTVGSASENQTDFIMESYLAPDERLRRRQARISAALAQDPAPATTPTTLLQ